MGKIRDYIFRSKKIIAPSYIPFGYFSIGTSGGTSEKYQYTDDTVVSATALTYPRTHGAGTANRTWGLIAYGGDVRIQKYKLNDDTVIGNGGTTSYVPQWGTAFGNLVNAHFAGYTNNDIEKYNYSSEVVTISSGAVGLARERMSSFGNNVKGYICGGATNAGSVMSNYTDIYTYSSDSVLPGIVLGLARQYATGQGNGIVGFIFGGYTTALQNYVDKYTLSNDTRETTVALTLKRGYNAAVGDDSKAVLGAGYVNISTLSATTTKYQYSDGVQNSGTSLNSSKHSLTAFSTSSFGL